MRLGFTLAVWLSLALAQPSDSEKEAVRATLQALGAAPTPCADYSQRYRAGRINADPLWTCGFLAAIPRSPERFSEDFWRALGESYTGRLSQVFSPLSPNPDCSCMRTAAYFRRGGKRVAWSLSFADTRPYGKGTLVWVKHQVLP